MKGAQIENNTQDFDNSNPPLHQTSIDDVLEKFFIFIPGKNIAK